MIPSIIESLEQKGCKTLSRENLSAVIQCSESFLVKSPSEQWSLFVPTSKLSPLQKRLSSIRPQSIDSGKFVRSGSWGRMFDFSTNNEIRYHFNEENMKSIKDDEIQKTLSEIHDQEQFFNEDIKEFDLQSDFKKNVNSLGSRLNTILVSNLKSEFHKPVICHSEPQIRKFWMPEGERLAYRISTTCVVPGSKQSIENVINSKLERGTISQADVRYISSRMTKNKNFMLSGVNLYQQGSSHPLLKFTVKDDSIMSKKDFVDEIKTIENDFKLNDAHPKQIEISAFTKYLF